MSVKDALFNRLLLYLPRLSSGIPVGGRRLTDSGMEGRLYRPGATFKQSVPKELIQCNAISTNTPPEVSLAEVVAHITAADFNFRASLGLSRDIHPVFLH
jgi:hypothetical protein